MYLTRCFKAIYCCVFVTHTHTLTHSHAHTLTHSHSLLAAEHFSSQVAHNHSGLEDAPANLQHAVLTRDRATLPCLLWSPCDETCAQRVIKTSVLFQRHFLCALFRRQQAQTKSECAQSVPVVCVLPVFVCFLLLLLFFF